jgi:hypothetical protein
MSELLTRRQLAEWFNVSERTVDRWRAAGLDLGEFRAHPSARPRFYVERLKQGVGQGRLLKAKRQLQSEQQKSRQEPSLPVHHQEQIRNRAA